MSDFPNPDEWEQTYPNQLDGPSGHVYDARTQTYWRRKPQEPTYSPSPEAKALLKAITDCDYDPYNPGDVKEARIIDQALAAARQQGRDEGYADGHEAGVVKTMFDLQPDEDGEGHAHATPNQQVSGVAKDSQGAGFRIEPGLGTNGPDSDGSTVASPLRGRAYCAGCGNLATGEAWIGDRRYCHGDDDIADTCYERAVVHETWNPPDQIQVSQHSPAECSKPHSIQGKVLVDRADLERLLTASEHFHGGGWVEIKDRLRAALVKDWDGQEREPSDF